MERNTEVQFLDERLLVRLAAKDSSAFALVYVRHAPKIFAYLAAKTNVDEAADLTQEVFERALRALPRYRDRDAPFRAWLFRIARNAAVDFRRKRRVTIVPITAVDLTSSEDLLDRAVQAEQLDRLRSHVDRLNDADRELLELRYAGGLRSREIAATVGRSEAAVKKQLWRIVRGLKEQMNEFRS